MEYEQSLEGDSSESMDDECNVSIADAAKSMKFLFENSDEEEEQIPPSKSEAVKWSDSATKLAILLLKKYRPQLGTCIKFRTKRKLMAYISQVMATQGFNFTPLQVENKIKGLEKNYRNKAYTKSKDTRVKFPFEFQDLKELFPDSSKASPSTSTQSRVKEKKILNNFSFKKNAPAEEECIRSSKKNDTREEKQDRYRAERLKLMRERTVIMEREMKRKNDILERIAHFLTGSTIMYDVESS